MVAIAGSLAVSVWLEKRVPLMPLVSAAVVFVFGGLTLALDSEIFIKMKPTIINALFAVILFSGLALGRPFLKHLFGAVMTLDEEGWKKLSFRWAIFYPFPGTAGYTIAKDAGLIDWDKWENMGNYFDASCLKFGAEHDLFLEKLGALCPWYVNALTDWPCSKAYAAWRAVKAFLSGKWARMMARRLAEFKLCRFRP